METFIIEKKEILSRIESQIAAHESILSNSKNESRSSNESSTSSSSSTSKTSIINNANTINNQISIQQNQQEQEQYQQQLNQLNSQSADQQLVTALEIDINELKRKIMELKTNLSFSQTSQQIQQYQVNLIYNPLYFDIL